MGAPTPNVIVTPFGADAPSGNVPGGAVVPIPVPSQTGTGVNIASFTDGFPTATMTPEGSGGVNMRGPDMQGILYMLSAYCQALTGGQFWTFNSTWATANSGYAAGAILAMANGQGLWLNTSAGNTNNPDTTAAATSGWLPLPMASGYLSLTGLTNANVTLTAVQAAAPVIVLSGTLTGNIQIIFPTWPREWTVVNNTTGAFSVTCKTASGTGVVIPQTGYGSPTLIYGDTTNIQPLVPLQSLPPSITPVGSTLLERSSAGYGYVTYLNQASSYNENPAILSVGVQNTAADGFMRWATLAYLQSQMNLSSIGGGATAGQLPALSGMNGQVTAAQVPQGAVTQYAAAIASAAGFGGSIGGTGYMTTSTGLIIQWGQVTGNNFSGVQNIWTYFPVTFPRACFVVVGTQKRSSTASFLSGALVDNVGLSSGYWFDSSGCYIFLNADSDGIQRGTYIALGF